MSLKNRPRLSVLATGGTIAGEAEEATESSHYRAALLGVETILGTVPDLGLLADVHARQLCAIDSKDADPDFWRLVGLAVRQELDDPSVDGVVVLHGTDTMEETAWYLQLVLPPGKPVVLTGAMRPANAPSADGPMNLLQAIRVASDPAAAGRGVLVALNGRIQAARNVRKAHTTRVDAFVSGEVGDEGAVEDKVAWYRPSPSPSTGAPSSRAFPDALPRVDLLFAYPGASVDAIAHAVANGARGIVYAGTGHGTMSAAVIAALVDARRAGVAVVRASRAEAGGVSYDVGCADSAFGFLVAGGLSPGKARIALMLLLAQGLDAPHWPTCLDTWATGQR